MKERNWQFYLPWSLAMATSAYAYINHDIKIDVDDIAGVFLKVEGTVEFRGPSIGIWAPGRVNQALPAGSWVSTGESSSAQILVGESQLIELSENAHIVIGDEKDSDGGLFVNVLKGEIVVNTEANTASQSNTFSLAKEPKKSLRIQSGNDVTTILSTESALLSVQKDLREKASVNVFKGNVLLTDIVSGVKQNLENNSKNKGNPAELLVQKNRERRIAKIKALSSLMKNLSWSDEVVNRFIYVPGGDSTVFRVPVVFVGPNPTELTNGSLASTDLSQIKLATLERMTPATLDAEVLLNQTRLSTTHELSKSEVAAIKDSLWTEIPLKLIGPTVDGGKETTSTSKTNISIVNPEHLKAPLTFAFQEPSLNKASRKEGGLFPSELDHGKAEITMQVRSRQALKGLYALISNSQATGILAEDKSDALAKSVARSQQVHFHIGNERIAAIGWPRSPYSKDFSNALQKQLKSDFWYTGSPQKMFLSRAISPADWKKITSEPFINAYCESKFIALPAGLLNQFDNTLDLVRSACSVVHVGRNPPAILSIREAD